MQIYLFLLKLVFCRSSRIAFPIAYCTGLSTVQVDWTNSEKANEDLLDRIYEFLNMVEKVGGPGSMFPVCIRKAAGEP